MGGRNRTNRLMSFTHYDVFLSLEKEGVWWWRWGGATPGFSLSLPLSDGESVFFGLSPRSLIRSLS